MPKVRSLFVVLAIMAVSVPPAIAAGVALPAPAAPHPGVVLAGAAKIDSTWHVGASAGQYASDGFAVGSHGIDPTTHSTRRLASYGIQSREWARALVVEGPDATRFALVTNDLYIPQDLLNRRVAGILAEHDAAVARGDRTGPITGITGANMTVSVSHSHSSPYYASPSWGVWAFQDVMDIRFFEHIAQKMADAVIAASARLVPVRVGASVSYFDKLQRHSFGPTIADDGTPAGFPEADIPANRTVARTENEKTVTVVAIDDISGEAPAPLATWVVFGLHPEMLDGNDLLTGEYVNTMYRIVDREIGGITLFSQQNTGTAEPARDAKTYPPSARLEFSHREYAQVERAARLLADAVEDTRADVAANTPEDEDFFVSWQTGFLVKISDIRFAPPSLRTYPGVSNCRMEKAFRGNPGIPVVGLPDCEYPLSGAASALPFDPGITYQTLRAAGIPIPDNLSAPAYTGLEETLQVHLQAVRLGDIAITVCPCEQWGDQSRNIRSRLNKTPGDFWDGFDWAVQTTPSGRDWCVQNADTTWTCANPENPSADLAPVSDETYRRMRAQIHNDARGWEDIAYSVQAESEEVDVAKIKGNYTHEELTGQAYDLVIPVGMSNDYWGYIATYREYQRGDHYRKALTGLGPHSSDFLATRLTRMAASLNGGPAVELGPKDVLYSPEDVHEYQRAQAFGAAARAVTAAYETTLPADGGRARIVEQPADIKRFSAAKTSWIGGSNYTDTPNARVERLEGDAWVPFGDGSGEVQVKANYPIPDQMGVWAQGQFEWRWEATFEAFDSDITLPDASRIARRQTPAGTYRFVIDGERREGTPPAAVPYRLETEAFVVSPWDGVDVRDLRIDPDGTASFTLGSVTCYTYRQAGLNCDPANGPITGYVVGPIDYPDTYASPFRFISGRDASSNLRTYGPGRADDEQFCFECSFRPWTDTGAPPARARVVVHTTDGALEVTATLGADGRYHTSFAPSAGDRVEVPAGGVTDAFGEYNGQAVSITR